MVAQKITECRRAAAAMLRGAAGRLPWLYRPVHALQGRKRAAREKHGAVIRGEAEIVPQHLSEQREFGVGVAGAAAFDGDQTRLDFTQSLVQQKSVPAQGDPFFGEALYLTAGSKQSRPVNLRRGRVTGFPGFGPIHGLVGFGPPLRRGSCRPRSAPA